MTRISFLHLPIFTFIMETKETKVDLPLMAPRTTSAPARFCPAVSTEVGREEDRTREEHTPHIVLSLRRIPGESKAEFSA